MIGHFNELLRVTADEGVSATIGLSWNHSAAEIDELLEAWSRERHECIETGLLLDAAQHLLDRILREGIITSASRRKSRNLLRAIEAVKRDS